MTDTETGAFSEPTGDISGIDADALMSAIESGQEIPASDAATPNTTETPVTQSTSEIEFTWNGKPIKAPLDKAKQWAAQGYDYAQKMAQFNQQQAAFKSQQDQLAALEAKWKPVEEFYAQNPDRFQKLWSDYQGGQMGVDPNNPLYQHIQALEQKLGTVSKFVEKTEAEKLQMQQQAEDKALTDEIQSIRDEFKDLDWATVDTEGKTLEMRVLEHAANNGIGKFRAAFRDFYHDQLVKLAEDRAKESLVKERQKQAKTGLLGRTPAPKTGLSDAENIKNKTYDQLFQEGLAELGIA